MRSGILRSVLSRFGIPVVAALAVGLPASQAAAAGSCSFFATITGYDADSSMVTVSEEKGNERKFFPKPEGTPRDTSKIPEKCKSKVRKAESFEVKSTGGRMTVTQIRTNFQGNMLNDVDDETWVGKEINKLIEDKTVVVVVVRQPPGSKRDAAYRVTTIYLPANEADLAEIKRLEDQATDVE